MADPLPDQLTLTTNQPASVPQFEFLAPAQSADEMGRLGHFRILRVLGQGGMGIVFHAEDIHLCRAVALKVIKPAAAADPAYRERFMREARATAALKSDHVITIHHVGEENDVLFLAMELLQGESLDHWLKRGCRPTLAQLLRLAREMTLALRAAHEKGLIHRDVKPANTWLEHPSGRVKLLDFGLARVNGEEVQLTVSGHLVGTPAFMAPEQANGEQLDCRCDLFSLGVVLYQLCTGTLPFRGNSIMAVLAALSTHQPPPVTEINPEIPPALAELVSRLLAKDRDDRPASAQAVLELLNDIRAHSEGMVPSSALPVAQAIPVAAPLATEALSSPGHASDPTAVLPERPSVPLGWIMLVAGLLGGGLVLVGAALFFTRDRGDRPETRLALPQPSATTTAPKPPVDEWTQRVSALTVPAQQVRAVRDSLKELNPGYVGKLSPTINQDAVTGLELRTDRVTDLTPLRALTRLEELTLTGSEGTDEQPKGQLADLSPLRGLQLKSFSCASNPVADLSPLQGMKLTHCDLYYCARVKSLAPLRGMPLTYLSVAYCDPVSDLTALRGMQLTELNVGGTAVVDLSPVRGMPLSRLSMWGCERVTDLSALRGLPITYLNIGACPGVTDLTPLKGMKLESIELAPKTVTRGIEVLREMKSLKTIALSGDEQYSPAQFWKKYDAGEFKE